MFMWLSYSVYFGGGQNRYSPDRLVTPWQSCLKAFSKAFYQIHSLWNYFPRMVRGTLRKKQDCTGPKCIRPSGFHMDCKTTLPAWHVSKIQVPSSSIKFHYFSRKAFLIWVAALRPWACKFFWLQASY